ARRTSPAMSTGRDGRMVMTARAVIVIGLVCGGIAGGLFGAGANAIEEGGVPDAVRSVAITLKGMKNSKLDKVEDAERTAKGCIEFLVGFGLTLAFGSAVWAAGHRGGGQVLAEREPWLVPPPSPGEFQPPPPGDFLSSWRKAIPYVLALAVFLAAAASLE